MEKRDPLGMKRGEREGSKERGERRRRGSFTGRDPPAEDKARGEVEVDRNLTVVGGWLFFLSHRCRRIGLFLPAQGRFRMKELLRFQ